MLRTIIAAVAAMTFSLGVQATEHTKADAKKDAHAHEATTPAAADATTATDAAATAPHAKAPKGMKKAKAPKKVEGEQPPQG